MVQQAPTDRGEQTRRRILEVASRHFLERGYAGTSLNDLIKETGLTKGGFYFHFASKADLAIAALEQIRESWRAEVFANAGAHERAVDQITAMVRAIAASKRSSPASSAIGRICQDLANHGLGERVRPFDAWVVITADLFRRAQSQGEMDPAVDADAAARYAVMAFLGLDHVADVSGDPGLVERLVETYLAFTFNAVGMLVPVPSP